MELKNDGFTELVYSCQHLRFYTTYKIFTNPILTLHNTAYSCKLIIIIIIIIIIINNYDSRASCSEVRVSMRASFHG